MTEEIRKRISQIEETFSQEIETVNIHDDGEDFLVLEVNDGWMFRFPRNSAARKALQCERSFLPGFQRLSPIPIPNIRFSNKDFIGYRKIEGVQLTPRLFNTLPSVIRKRIARQLGCFLTSIHRFPMEQALEIGLTEGWNGWRKKAYQCFIEEAAPLLSITARANAIAFFEKFFALEWKQVVIHGDFYPQNHVFFDEKLQAVSGVIDFGDLTIEDAATDFQSIFLDFGEYFLQDVIASYDFDMDARFIERIKIRIKAAPLFDAAYACEYGFKGRFMERLSEIELAFGMV